MWLPTLLGIIAIFIGLPWLIVRVADWRRNSRSQGDGAKEERLLTPDWSCVERYLCRPVPAALRELYADRSLITGRDLPCGEELLISTFEALDEQAMRETRQWLGFDAVRFATTDFDDAIYLRPGANQPDTVYLTHHDGGDTEVVAESVAHVLTKLRQTASR